MIPMTITAIIAQQTGDIIQQDLMNKIIEWKNDFALNPEAIGQWVGVAQSLACLFTLIWVALKLYPVIAGEDKLSVLPLLRPFALAMVVMNWSAFVDLCYIPGGALEGETKTKFDGAFDEIRTLGKERYKLIDRQSKELTKASTDAKRAETNHGSSEMQQSDVSKESWDWFGIGAKIAYMQIYVITELKFLLLRFVEWIGLIFLNVCICGLLFMQAVTLMCLAILGPLSFAFSCLPPWRDAWSHWVARYISVSLWSGIGYLIMWGGCQLFVQFLQNELAVMRKLETASSNELAATLSVISPDVILFPLICIMLAIALFAVFPISTWVIQTSGGAAGIGAAAGAAATAAGVGTMVVKK